MKSQSRKNPDDGWEKTICMEGLTLFSEDNMNYLDEAKNVLKEGGGADLQSQIFQFENPGDELAGVILDVEEFTGSEFDTACKRYTMDTGDRRVSFILGSATDRSLDLTVIKGKLVYIRYEGQKEAKKGKHYNCYTVKEIPAPLRKKV